MRILSWNINGIRTLPQYHPWNTFKNLEGILDHLDADIICFQEMKSSRQALARDVATPENYRSFFSFPVKKGGYSGVAVYTKSAQVVPLKAEEGIAGCIQPKPPLSPEERISSTYPSLHDISYYGDTQDHSFDLFDSEGRGLVLDFGLFVLINVYCPNETSDDRLSFKMNYHLMLEERVRRFIEEGREVVVLGDINVCATPMDHCDGHLPSNASTFWEHPARAWFHKWLHPQGPMVDVVRRAWPDRKAMYTCWNTKIQARETNYGTRIDYILVTEGMLKWIKHADIQQSLKGSDHCPIYVDLHDEVVLESGETLKLRDAMQQGEAPPQLPRIAAKYWPEFSEKQTRLSSFFGKKTAIENQTERTTSNKLTIPSKLTTLKRPSSSSLHQAGTSSNKKAKKDASLGTIDSFLGKPTPAVSSSKAGSSSASAIEIEVDSAPPQSTSPLNTTTEAAQLEADYRLALELAEENDEGPSLTPPTPSSSQSKAAWSTLFTPAQPPKCTVHGEPAKKWTVNKAGPNKGRSFYVCARPVGPGYDKGKGERLREEVDHTYKCNYFKWASDVKRESSSLPGSQSK
ncbi:DNase I-like protein [Trametopsis cervina]|nr:DNase I-like protein [Trametopsis cervina]